MAFALGVVGLAPNVFWAMTPKELAAAIRGRVGPAGLAHPTKADLDAMLARFPDT